MLKYNSRQKKHRKIGIQEKKIIETKSYFQN